MFQTRVWNRDECRCGVFRCASHTLLLELCPGLSILNELWDEFMCVQRFEVVLKLAKIGDNDRIWFGRWLRRYAVFLRQPETISLLVALDSVKQFCRTLLASKIPAWQRLQAVRAIEFYRNQVLETAEPDLLEVRQILGRIAESERHNVDELSPADEAQLIGVVNANEPQWIQKMRAELRLMHLIPSRRSVRNICRWC